MDNKIIKSSRKIDLFIKIKTIYDKNLIIDYFHLNKENIQIMIGENIPVIISDINITESQTEKHIKEAINICYSELDMHKYIYTL